MCSSDLKACGAEAAWAGADVDILAPDNLIQLINHARGTQVLTKPAPGAPEVRGPLPDLREIKGQEAAKRAARFAEEELAKVELAKGPLPPSIRDMLRRRLADNFSKKLERAASAKTAQVPGSADAVAGILHEMNDKDAWAKLQASEEFRMLEADTDAEVRRLMGGSGDRQDELQLALGSVDVNLFRRVHEAHRRRWKR